VVSKERDTTTTVVCLEAGRKRVFVSALDWPGWCRSGKGEEPALEALAAYAPRYHAVAEEAGLAFPEAVAEEFEIVERLAGNATTDFGAPGVVGACDSKPLGAEEAGRLAALVAASWRVFDRIAAHAPAELRKGPRGGGRDRDKMIDHVLGAEAGYARMLGIKHRQPALGDAEAVKALRDDIIGVLSQPSDGSPPRPKGWPVRYAARRLAWHVLDHAWEMEDRSDQRGA
jgi:hypothetical protein